MSKRVSVRVEEELKDEANKIFDAIGLDMSTAIKLFLKKSVQVRGIPFQLTVENKETMEAILEAETGQTKAFNTVDDLFMDLDDEA